MRIGYILNSFPPLSETFIRREILALRQAGHRLFVYTHDRRQDPLVLDLSSSGLVIREIPFLKDELALVRAVQADGIEHLHSSLMIAAQRTTYQVAQKLQVPFSLTAYSGHDIFTARDPQLYREPTANPLCEALVVEDPFMSEFVVERLGARPDKIAIIPNAFDLETYRLAAPRELRERIVILAIARFVEKKGLIHLIQAFTRLAAMHSDAELWLVGQGPEQARLHRAAGSNTQIKFLGLQSEAQTRQTYADADIFCLPCIRTQQGDADGVPTTVLEAMAFELPIVGSNLLSMPYYVRDGQEGLLTPPGDVAAITTALDTLIRDAERRRAIGRAGRMRVEELCDLHRNVRALETIMVDGRRRRWQHKQTEVVTHARTVSSERELFYTACRERAIGYFKPHGRLLDIGCGQGKLRPHLPRDVCYVGCDALPHDDPEPDFPFFLTTAEGLPFPDASFDSAVLYAVLAHVFDIDAVLEEAARVLKPGGHLYLQECYNNPNPIHLNHLTDTSLHQRVAEHFHIVRSEPANEYLMLIVAQKRESPVAAEERPLVSIAITSFNRGGLIRRCIDSALVQTYRPIEIVVVDDGSTDGTRQILESYGSALKIVYHDRNLGRVAAKNHAVAGTSATARYLAILDSDDYYHPSFVERCVDFLERERTIGLVYTDDILVDNSGRELRRQAAVEPWSIDAWVRTRNLRGDTWLARRDLIMQTALLDEMVPLDEDYDLLYQLLELTTFAHLPEHLVYIRYHDDYTPADRLELARCHAANLVKYGYSPEYAFLRARANPEWVPAIEEGIALGRMLRERREQAARAR